MKESFREKVLGNGHAALFEVVPPVKGRGLVQASKEIADILEGINVDAINIPEIRNESRNGPRNIAYMEKEDPVSYGSALQSCGFEAVINRCTVYESPEEQRLWIGHALKKGMGNIVAVGGESGKKTYPGPSVTEFCDIARHFSPEILLGGITIPTRLDEPERLLKKSGHGIEFFVSQVLYESRSFKNLLKDYHLLCKRKSTKAKRLFISLAPVSSDKDIYFLKWLGVEIPHHAEQRLAAAHDKARESMEICQEILEDILDFGSRLEMPLGINVEHIMAYNTSLAAKMLRKLAAVYRQF
ncbi:MAG: methylenetetrahydrofolate reductase [Candidatus Aenigmarchaeota archaeon]|nr:methylenetetrahydrofolate reductase [Candidatus Aenigmarchaeota archaeon]